MMVSLGCAAARARAPCSHLNGRRAVQFRSARWLACAGRGGAAGSRLLCAIHGSRTTRQDDRLSLPQCHGLRLGVELAADEAAAAAMAAFVRARACGCLRLAHPWCPGVEPEGIVR